jgi:transcriptional regulator with XRE-family HTH domain
MQMDKSIYTPDHQRLCFELRRLRTERGLKQGELAGLLGVNQTFVSKYERGERRLDLLELREVCRALGVSLAEFVQPFDD